jgi:hypothetical protein
MDKAKELAILILKEDPNWTVEAINEAMKGEKQTNPHPENSGNTLVIPAWVDDIGKINFYNDLYQRDDRLAIYCFLKIQNRFILIKNVLIITHNKRSNLIKITYVIHLFIILNHQAKKQPYHIAFNVL